MPNQSNKAKKASARNRKKVVNKTASNMQLVIAPVSKAYKTKNNNPVFKAGPKGKVIVSHSEYVHDVTQVVAQLFSAQSYRINPANKELFPWLSSIAPNYEKYKFNKFHVRYVPAISTASPGRTMMMIDYDASDPLPESVKEIANSANSSMASIWDKNEMNGIISELNKYRYTAEIIPPNTDIKLYDVGVLTLAKDGSNAAIGSVLGSLWIDYVVELDIPQMKQSLNPSSHYSFNYGNKNEQNPVNTGLSRMSGIVVNSNFNGSFGDTEHNYVLPSFVSSVPVTPSPLGNTTANNKTPLKSAIFDSLVSYSKELGWQFSQQFALNDAFSGTQPVDATTLPYPINVLGVPDANSGFVLNPLVMVKGVNDKISSHVLKTAMSSMVRQTSFVSSTDTLTDVDGFCLEQAISSKVIVPILSAIGFSDDPEINKKDGTYIQWFMIPKALDYALSSLLSADSSNPLISRLLNQISSGWYSTWTGDAATNTALADEHDFNRGTTHPGVLEIMIQSLL